MVFVYLLLAKTVAQRGIFPIFLHFSSAKNGAFPTLAKAGVV
jgi:hypothetical protein